MSKFSRPESLEASKVYREFTSNKDESLKFRVQDLPEEYFDAAIELLVEHFMPEETFCVAKKLFVDEEVLNIMIEFYRAILNERISVGCFAEGSKELIAVNLMTVKSVDDEVPEYNNKTINEIIEVLEFIDAEFNPCKVFEVDTYLSSYVLCVHPSYRGFGIATEILKSRVEILKALNLTVTSTMFTTMGSQIAAKKANLDESWSMAYDDITAKFPSFDFSTASTKVVKKLSLKI